MVDMQKSERPTQTPGIAGRRLIAVLVAVALVSLYFGAFVLAEGDAYGTVSHPRDGFIHVPWILGMPLAMIIGFPATSLIERLWSNVDVR